MDHRPMSVNSMAKRKEGGKAGCISQFVRIAVVSDFKHNADSLRLTLFDQVNRRRLYEQGVLRPALRVL